VRLRSPQVQGIGSCRRTRELARRATPRVGQSTRRIVYTKYTAICQSGTNSNRRTARRTLPAAGLPQPEHSGRPLARGWPGSGSGLDRNFNLGLAHRIGPSWFLVNQRLVPLDVIEDRATRGRDPSAKGAKTGRAHRPKRAGASFPSRFGIGATAINPRDEVPTAPSQHPTFTPRSWRRPFCKGTLPVHGRQAPPSPRVRKSPGEENALCANHLASSLRSIPAEWT